MTVDGETRTDEDKNGTFEVTSAVFREVALLCSPLSEESAVVTATNASELGLAVWLCCGALRRFDEILGGVGVDEPMGGPVAVS